MRMGNAALNVQEENRQEQDIPMSGQDSHVYST
jgi:hypothetical protein